MKNIDISTHFEITNRAWKCGMEEIGQLHIAIKLNENIEVLEREIYIC